MSIRLDTEVLVAGGGPVGLFTGLALARAGARVKVLEEQWKPASRSYALALHPETLRLFAKYDLTSELLEKGNSVEVIGLYGEGRQQAEIQLSLLPDRFPFTLVLPQHLLEGVLLAALEKAGGQMLWSHSLADFECDSAGVSSTVEKLKKESTGYSVSRTEWIVQKTLSIRSSFIVGADGHRSRVRRKLGIDFPKCGPDSTFAVFEFSTSGASGKELQIVLDQDNMNVLWPLPDGRFRWSFELVDFTGGVDPRTKSRLFVQFRDEHFPHVTDDKLTELMAERAPWFDAKVVEVAWSAAIRFERRLAESFGGNRAWLVGDSAHLALPIGIQSMNVGFRESADLAGRMARLVPSGASSTLAAKDLEVQGLLERKEYSERWRTHWNDLLELSDTPPLRPDASDWVRQRASRVPPCIPASGADLTALLRQIGIA